MVLTKEYRMVLPMTVAEYQKGHHYVLNTEMKKTNKNGAHILERSPYTDEKTGAKGEYVKILKKSDANTPALVRKIAPSGSLDMYEETWDTYPNMVKTVLTNGYVKDTKFKCTLHAKYLQDSGTTEDPFDSDQELETVFVDFLNTNEKKPAHDPTTFLSTKTGRGKLTPNWVTDVLNQNGDKQPDGTVMGETPVMCMYTLLEVEFNMALQNKVEKVFHSQLQQPLINHVREIFCTIDEWYDMSIEEIRAIIDDKDFAAPSK